MLFTVFDANLRLSDSQATGSSARDLFNLSDFEIPVPRDLYWKSSWELIPQELYGTAQFLDKYKHFKFQSFLPRSEIIDALIKVRSDCNKIANIALFNTSKITKSVRLEEFEQLQVQSFSQEIQVIKDRFLNLVCLLIQISIFVSLKNGIKVSLEDVGKGWFNLQENRMELYEVSKLKKFMTVVKFMMEDSIRFMIEDSLESYAKLVEVSASSIVSVISTNEVRVTRTKDKKKFPLFMIDLVISNNAVTYSTPLPLFEEKLLYIIKQVLGMFQNTPTLERELMKHLIWTHTPMLSSVHIMEDGIVHIQARIQAALSDAVSPLLKYIETFNMYKEFLEMNTETYLQKFKEVKHSLSEYKEEILVHLKKQEEIESSIPENISTGMFFINCSEVRAYLANKRKSLASSSIYFSCHSYFAVLSLLVEKARQVSDKVNKEFSGISRKVTNRYLNFAFHS